MLARMLERSGRRLLVLAALLMGCGAPRPLGPPTVEVAAAAAAAEDAPPEAPPRRTALKIDAAPAPAAPACPKVEPKRLPCHLVPKCNGLRGKGRTPRERDCNEIVWFGLWTEEAMADPRELLAAEGTLSDLIDVNGAARVADPNLRAAVARYRAALLAEKQDAASLAQAICVDDAAARDSSRARLLADADDELQARTIITRICNH